MRTALRGAVACMQLIREGLNVNNVHWQSGSTIGTVGVLRLARVLRFDFGLWL